MTYDAERAQQPAAPGSKPLKQHAPHAPAPGPAPDPRAPFTGSDGLPRSAGFEPQLLPAGERDKLSVRLQQAVNNFIDSPRHAVEEADGTFDEVVSRLNAALGERQCALRANWQSQDTQAETEDLRVALQQYREITEHLLQL
ncbi:hypothetical protein GCM10010331_17640 [Streptomyces xanthochromogenes]|uniref:hypothetical protein n=1 Tax=Streptomyces xanthochromogenes TaxID=67384 RepID=UPI001988C2CC|nr:hypothetical protein [Streptomyces xanthochromogenes]GHB31510.1 hypothetical protein GCM10010331_17640 [Streptomyces xanthochromogenes]